MNRQNASGTTGSVVRKFQLRIYIRFRMAWSLAEIIPKNVHLQIQYFHCKFLGYQQAATSFEL
jgi:hypothetical protein